MPIQIKSWRFSQQENKARKVALQGLINLSQGQWKKAERQLIKSVKNSEMPLLNYLSAAKAAQKQNAPERRDHYLALAHKSMPEADFSVKLTQAELQFAHGQIEQALATLVNLNRESPKHSHIMVLLSQLYQQLKRWNKLIKLIPQIRKHHGYSEKELYAIEKEEYIEFIQLFNTVNSNENNERERLKQLWHNISRDLKKDGDIIEIYCNKLLQLNDNDEAELILRNAIKKEWRPSLIKLYGLEK